MTAAPIRYHDGIETLNPDENETIDRIVAAMTHESEITAKRYGHAVRASHAKISGVAVGALEIRPNWRRACLRRRARIPSSCASRRGPANS
ncbi:hypothetical protein AFFFEF_02513 [Methylorubrum extorquens]